MSYLSYITNHYQNARNDHANATKAMKYIQHYRYKKSASKIWDHRKWKVAQDHKKTFYTFSHKNPPE